jgi:hypothetical protein
MAYLRTILAYPSKLRLKGALNRIYGYLSRYRTGRNGGIDFDPRSVRPAGGRQVQSRPTTNLVRRPVPEGTEESRARHGSAGKENQRKPSPL